MKIYSEELWNEACDIKFFLILFMKFYKIKENLFYMFQITFKKTIKNQKSRIMRNQFISEGSEVMIRKDIYIYPAVFVREREGYHVSFPDLSGLEVHIEDIEELSKVKKVLADYIYTLEESNSEIPRPSFPNKIQIRENEFIQTIDIFMPDIREKYFYY